MIALTRSWRFWVWGGGTLAMLLIAWSMSGRPASARSATAAVLLAWALFALLVETVIWMVRPVHQSRWTHWAPRDQRPADGEVGTVKVLGVRCEPNPKAEGFARFVAMEPLEAGSHPDLSDLPKPSNRKDFPPLLGRVGLVSLFIGRDDQAWSLDEIAQVHKALKRAGSWIEREALRWEAKVNVDLADTYFEALDDQPRREVGLEVHLEETSNVLDERGTEIDTLARVSRVAAQFGFQDAADLTSRIRERVEADHLVWILHQRDSGRSFAIPGDLTELPGVTLAVCHARESNAPGPLHGPPFPDPITFVHEVLHLFGANDKYDFSLSEFPPKTVTERDVMYLGTTALIRLRIDRLTAAEIGWVDPRSLTTA